MDAAAPNLAFAMLSLCFTADRNDLRQGRWGGAEHLHPDTQGSNSQSLICKLLKALGYALPGKRPGLGEQGRHLVETYQRWLTRAGMHAERLHRHFFAVNPTALDST